MNVTFGLKMLTEEEEKFVKWWQENRLKEKKILSQLTVGLPLGIAFGLPILLGLMFRGWYKRMPYISGTQLTIVLIAVLSIIVFYAVFRMRFKWELNEQIYNELRSKMEKETEKQQS